MEIKNRLFPYPVLCGDTDDYIGEVDFSIVPKTRETTHEILFEYDFSVNCHSLENVLRKGEAEYILHIECSTTSFRIALKSSVPHIDYRLSKSRVNGEVNLVAMIVAKKAIDDYDNSDLNEDYAEEKISFNKGAILAYQNLPSVFVSKKTDSLANNESFFTVIKQVSLDPNEIKPLAFNLHSDKIQILVDEKTYEAFLRYQQSKSIAMAMLLLPALSFMVTEAADTPDSYSQFVWFQRMKKFYSMQGKDFVEDVLRSDDNPVNIAQEMLQNPISNAYRELFALED